MNQRMEAVKEWLNQNTIDAALITAPENVFYLSGYLSNPHERLLALAVFQDAEPFLVVPKMEAAEAKESGWDAEIIGYTDIEDPWEQIKQSVENRSLTIKRIAIEKEHMNVERYEKVNVVFSVPEFVSAEEKLRQLRMIKTEEEMMKIREACRLADYAIEVGVSEINEGKTEMEILAAIEFELKKAGINEMSFSTMVLTGKNAASPHGTPGTTKVQRGDLVLFDLGVVYEGYCSDITRTVAYGDINDKQREIYETVLRAQETAVTASLAGTSCSEIDLTARRLIAEKGYGDYFPHRLGHGLGISVHEYPSLTETNPLILRPGMVYTIEPGIYVPNVAGVRIEDDILITENGFEVLTKYPKTLQIIK
ncbi:aminopeptidase P family protein [Peribacillus cavernae]|uniref:Aminopeptidase P family protein n=1 Tax=Peribacillus cavernae TaxID=1674310 RepID=A0A3S0VIQ9_9BACI|nr:Xaa-Pro peptidase family protein [Peribacillus cavernae]MDQ0220066.1 Xaa-Pro dipeptidase [Peribacillus cavernae]RUQ25434.1 aminopeptidase P family protein [Peribacillus cavernae]